ncbi:hypothetical protein N7466_005222 [Penicillium verhagenii]|uniref:uncharacterized protein n=1 Tax=Penicillium verhagenii TaxID=1562060 RepID=UPI0025456112|nr:uncharacterized protein N7466_005222 [Penicillium verhagenii]KAJ5935675.1 hypothetical protein N7466_005222 [Penicillium verhagenii]
METSGEQAGSPNDINDLFDYDVGLDELFQGNQDASNNEAAKPAADPSSLGLGLDEEVKITKKRQPIAKLDDARLLSQPGIPKLRRAAKTKLRFKGKGHEVGRYLSGEHAQELTGEIGQFSDATRLLNFYQLWLDDLYPRAKFSDGLAMIEKLGHTKRIQTMRREWIDEEKRKVFERDMPESINLPTRLSSGQNDSTTEVTNTSISQPAPGGSGGPDLDLFMPDPEGTTQQVVSHPEPDDDDLEDLLREEDEMRLGEPHSAKQVPNSANDDFDAEYEAMNDMGL